MASSRFTIEAVYRTVDKVTQPVRRMSSRVNKSFRRIGNGIDRVNRKMKKFGKTARGAFGVAGAAGAVAVLTLAIRGLITTGAEFEQQLVSAGARFEEPIKKGSVAFGALKDAARDAGAITQFTATEAAGALNFFAKAGLNAKQSIALLMPATRFATASEMDLARATDIATDAMDIFGLRSTDAAETAANFGRLTDVMSKAVSSANLDVEQLFEAIAAGGPAVKATGTSMETIIALTEQLASRGLKGSAAGVALKNVFLKLASSPVQTKLKSLGVSVKEIEGPNIGEMRDFADVMFDLNKALADKSGVDKIAIINSLFGLRGVTAVTGVLSDGIDKLLKYRDGLVNAGGKTAEMAAIMEDTRKGALLRLNSAFTELTLSISDATDTGISRMIEGLTKVVRVVDKFVDQNPEIAKYTAIFLAVAAAAAAVAVVVAGIAAGIAFLASSAVGLAAGIIALKVVLVGAFVAFALTFQPVRTFFSWLLDTLATIADHLATFASITPLGAVLGALGFGDDEDQQSGRESPGVVGPEARLEASMTRTQNNNATLTIAGAPEGSTLDKKGVGPGVGIQLAATGAFP